MKILAYPGNEIPNEIWFLIREMRNTIYCQELGVPNTNEFVDEQERSSIHLLGIGS